MGIDINVASHKVVELKECAKELEFQKRKMAECNDSLLSYWKTDETSYIYDKFGDIVKSMQEVINEISVLAGDIASVTSTIKDEERLREILVEYANDTLHVIIDKGRGEVV